MKQVPEPSNDAGGKTKPSNTNGESLDQAPDELFGIPPKAHFSIEILKRIKELTEKSDINIQSVRQKQYQEIYLFQKGNEISRVDINYNGKRKITRITAPEQTELSLEIIELISPLKGLVIPVIPDTTDELFGIPPKAHFSIEILKRIKELTEKSDINIQSVRKNGYQETYLFQKGNEISRVDINYNGKRKITRITAPEQTELSLEIIELISPLKGLVIPIIPKIPIEIVFEEKFLNDFHKRLHPLVEKKGITIANVESLDWAQRYTFIRSGKNAVFDVFFNGKKQFTKYAPVKNLCTSKPLSDDIQKVLTEGLSQ